MGAGKPATLPELVGRIDGLIAILETQELLARNSHTQTVIHKSENMGFFGGIAVASCIATIFLMLAFMIIENRSYTHLDNQIDQLRAWSDVNRAAIAKLQAEHKPGG